MRRSWRLRLVALCLALCLIATLIVMFVSVGQHSLVAQPGRPATSPSGRFKLVLSEDESRHWMSFTIVDALDPGEAPLCSPEERLATGHRIIALWDEQDRAWIYSGDVGTYFWERNENGKWIKHAYVDSDVPAPRLLKELNPSGYY